MITKVLNHAQLQLLDEIVGNAKLACEDKEKACLLGGVLSFIRTHENYDSDTRVYKVELSEIITRVVEIEATNEQEAIDKVRQQYEHGELTLDISDYLESSIKIAEGE